jgi:hypothetical protein
MKLSTKFAIATVVCGAVGIVIGAVISDPRLITTGAIAFLGFGAVVALDLIPRRDNR